MKGPGGVRVTTIEPACLTLTDADPALDQEPNVAVAFTVHVWPPKSAEATKVVDEPEEDKKLPHVTGKTDQKIKADDVTLWA